MLYLSRKIGESIVIQGDIEVTVMEIRGQSVRLGVTFPKGVQVLRRELADRIAEHNQEASKAHVLLQNFLTPQEAEEPSA